MKKHFWTPNRATDALLNVDYPVFQVFLVYKASHEDLVDLAQNADKQKLHTPDQVHRHLSLQETHALLSDPNVLESVFPDNVLVVGNQWLPMRKHPGNLLYSAAMGHCVGSFDKSTGSCEGITQVFSSQSHIGSTHHFIHYGRQIQVLLNHICLYLCHVVRITRPGDRAGLVLQFPVNPLEDYKQDVVDFLAPHMGAPRVTPTFSHQRVLAMSSPLSVSRL